MCDIHLFHAGITPIYLMSVSVHQFNAALRSAHQVQTPLNPPSANDVEREPSGKASWFVHVQGYLAMIKRPPLGPYSRPMPTALGRS